jgi:hypothetical protein
LKDYLPNKLADYDLFQRKDYIVKKDEVMLEVPKEKDIKAACSS